MQIPVLNGETRRSFSGLLPRTETSRLSPSKHKIGVFSRETENPDSYEPPNSKRMQFIHILAKPFSGIEKRGL